jgi:hypothetical protein
MYVAGSGKIFVEDLTGLQKEENKGEFKIAGTVLIRYWRIIVGDPS